MPVSDILTAIASAIVIFMTYRKLSENKRVAEMKVQAEV